MAWEWDWVSTLGGTRMRKLEAFPFFVLFLFTAAVATVDV